MLKRAGRLKRYCTPGKVSRLRRIPAIAVSSSVRRAPFCSVMLSLPVFSPASTGLASSRLPVPATA